MNEETNTTVVAAPKKRGRPPKPSSLELVLKALPSIKAAKEDALMHLQGFIHQPWTESNTTHKLKAVQLYLQHLDSLKDEDKVVSEQKDEVTNTTKVPSPDFEEVGIDSLSPEQLAAYQKAFGKKS